jgi:hypothetical protein
MPGPWPRVIGEDLVLFTIYAHPLDYPAGYVVRRFVTARGEVVPLDCRRAETLEAARALVPAGLVRLPRSAVDDRPIVESWI